MAITIGSWILTFIMLLDALWLMLPFHKIKDKLNKHPLIKDLVDIICKFGLPVLIIYMYFAFVDGAFRMESVQNVLKCFRFEMGTESLDALYEINPSIKIAFYASWLMVITTIYLSIISVFTKKISNSFLLMFTTKGEFDLVFGTAHVYDYAKTHPDKVVCWLTSDLTDEEINKLNENRIPYIKSSITSENIEGVLQTKNSRVNIIVFNDDDSLLYVTKIVKALKELKNEKFYLYAEIREDNLISIQEKVIGPYKTEEEKLEEADYNISQFINFFSRYEILANKFVFDFPITSFMPKGFINNELGAIDSRDKQINMILLGCGKVNNQIYRASVMNNQITNVFENNGKYSLSNHLINYYLFDDQAFSSKDDKNQLFFNDRIKNWEKNEYNSDEYFIKPERTHNEYKKSLNINTSDSLNDIRSIVDPGNPNTFTNIIISLDDDLYNIDYALKLSMFLKQIRNKENANYHIFVRVKEADKDIEKLLAIRDEIDYFGSQNELLSHDSIVNDSLLFLSHILNNEYVNKNGREQLSSKYYQKTLIRRKSDIFSSLNLTLKLELAGYKLDKDHNSTKILTEDMKKVFVSKNRAYYDDFLFFKNLDRKPLLSEVLSHQEHSRWNSFYISYGYVPMKKSDIHFELKKNPKDNETKYVIIKDDNVLRLHGCLTTYEELDLYHRYIPMLYLKEENKVFLDYYKEDFKAIVNKHINNIPNNDSSIKNTFVVLADTIMDMNIDSITNAIKVLGEYNNSYQSEFIKLHKEILMDCLDKMNNDRLNELERNPYYTFILAKFQTYTYDYSLMDSVAEIEKYFDIVKKYN